MKSDYPFSPGTNNRNEEYKAPTSRFVDEKISDDSDTEGKADSAMKPAGLSNPFWK